jgi:hypothetical protein
MTVDIMTRQIGQETLVQPGQMTASERIELFIDSVPQTLGVYDGSGMVPDANGVYLSQGSPHEGESLARFGRLDLLPGALLGAADSHHEVVFGRVLVANKEAEVRVAIKTFTSESGAAETEHDRLMDAHSLGFDTYRPLALARDGDSTYLITEYREEIETLDNANWTLSPRDGDRYYAEVAPNIHFIADNLAQMHAKGLFHGDAYAKNFGRTDAGVPVVVDLESATVARTAEELILLVSGGEDVRDSLAKVDVEHFWYGLTHPTDPNNVNLFLEDEPMETYLEVFTKDLLKPYIAGMRKYAPPELLELLNLEALEQGMYEREARSLGLL